MDFEIFRRVEVKRGLKVKEKGIFEKSKFCSLKLVKVYLVIVY